MAFQFLLGLEGLKRGDECGPADADLGNLRVWYNRLLARAGSFNICPRYTLEEWCARCRRGEQPFEGCENAHTTGPGRHLR
jgi:hypothetical protein